MNISYGVVEWEDNQLSAPGSLGKKLALALSVLTLAALALGSWLEAPDVKHLGDNTPVVVEAVNQEPAQVDDSVRAGVQAFVK